MSQRLHIGQTRESFYDCILENEDKARDKLLSEFFCLKRDIFFGPYKIKIGDIELYKKIEPLLLELFDSLGKQYPNDVWVFYLNKQYLEHPTMKELTEWINTLTRH